MKVEQILNIMLAGNQCRVKNRKANVNYGVLLKEKIWKKSLRMNWRKFT